jgi:cellulose synthase/poly-beta-1,6-N-acetylglucosamine synthase-like glycosyltransferase
MDNIILYFLIAFTVNYVLLFIIFAVFFATRKIISTEKQNIISSQYFVSVIIAVRNEEKNIETLIQSLKNQKGINNYEVLLIDDHSEDRTIDIARRSIDDKFRVLQLPKERMGKKEALKFGFFNSNGEIIAFTDADCIVPEYWLYTLLNQLQNTNSQMVCGPVEFYGNKNLFAEIINLEFLSLTGIGAASFFVNKPFMCNGANYAVYKSIYQDSMPFIKYEFSSGDDVFLLHKVKQNHKITFCNSYEAIVKTKAPASLKEFFAQRLRWASKIKGYRDFFAIYVSITGFIMSFALLFSIVVIFFTKNPELYAWLIFLKLSIDFLFLITVTDFYKQKKLLRVFILLELFHPIYIISTASISIFYKPLWKGRKIK